MEVNVQLMITPEEFFDAISEAIALDIQQATGKHVRPKNIKRGMSYTKKVNKRQSYQVTITAYEYPKVYSSRIDSTNGSNFMSYSVEPLDEGIGITYKEELIKSNGKSGDTGFTALFAKTTGIRRTKKRLANIEKYVIEKRNSSQKEEATENNENDDQSQDISKSN